MARFAFGSTLALIVTLGIMPGVQAQLPQVDGPLEETVDQVAGTVDQTVDDTVDQVQNTVNQTGDQVDDTVDQVQNTVNQTGDQAGETVNQTGDQAGETVNQTGDQAGDTVNQAGDTVQQTGNDTGGSVGQTLAEGGSTVGEASGSVGGAGGPGSGSQGGSGGSGDAADRGSANSRSRANPTGERGGARMAHLLSETSRPTLAPAVLIPLTVRLTNDADGDGSYRDTESAPEPTADVPLRVRVENVGSGELDITAIRHATTGPQGPASDAVCQEMVGARLAPGASAVCRFTAPGLAPGGGERVVTVVEVDVVETADPSTTGTVTDTSVVRTEGVSVLGAVARRILDSLATTGAQIAFLFALAIGLGAAGAWMLRAGNQHDRSVQVLPLGVGRTGPRGRGRAQRRARHRPPTMRTRSSVTGHPVARRGAARR